jgi:hypothetical protein
MKNPEKLMSFNSPDFLFRLVEQIRQPVFLLAVTVIILIALVISVIVVVGMFVKRLAWTEKAVLTFRSRSLNNFVEFATVEPDSAALRTIVNFNPLSLRHDERDITIRTIHSVVF